MLLPKDNNKALKIRLSSWVNHLAILTCSRRWYSDAAPSVIEERLENQEEITPGKTSTYAVVNCSSSRLSTMLVWVEIYQGTLLHYHLSCYIFISDSLYNSVALGLYSFIVPMPALHDLLISKAWLCNPSYIYELLDQHATPSLYNNKVKEYHCHWQHCFISFSGVFVMRSRKKRSMKNPLSTPFLIATSITYL